MSAASTSGDRTRIRARWVLGYDGTIHDHVLLSDAEVLVEDGRIRAVGARTDGPGSVVELGEAVVLPGLIDLDALADIDHALIDSWQAAPVRRALGWSHEYAVHGRRHVFDAGERRVIRRFALAQLALHGVTTFMPIAAETHSDWAESADDLIAMAEEAESIGLRMYGGPSFRSGVPVITADGAADVHWEPGLGEEGLADAVRFVEWSRHHGSDLVHGVLLPCRVESLTEELLDQTGHTARELGVPFRLHALQGIDERRLIAERSGETPLRLLERLGVLGPDLLIPHAVHRDDDPVIASLDREFGGSPVDGRVVDVLAGNGVTVVHCPLTSARYGVALSTFDEFRAAGVRIALGSDSFPPDLVRGMDVGSLVAKVLTGRLDAAPLADYVRAATLAGAEALGRTDLGRIAPGASADLAAFRLDAVRDGAIADPIRTLVMNGTARGLDFSMVAGRIIVRDGALPGVDVSALRAEAQEMFDRLIAAYPARSGNPTDLDTLFPSTFGRC